MVTLTQLSKCRDLTTFLLKVRMNTVISSFLLILIRTCMSQLSTLSRVIRDQSTMSLFIQILVAELENLTQKTHSQAIRGLVGQVSTRQAGQVGGLLELCRALTLRELGICFPRVQILFYKFTITKPVELKATYPELVFTFVIQLILSKSMLLWLSIIVSKFPPTIRTMKQQQNGNQRQTFMLFLFLHICI